MATLNLLQNGSVTLGSGDTSVTVTITSVTTANAYLVFSCRFNQVTPAAGGLQGVITNSTTLTFSRNTSGNAFVIEWYVAEFSSGISVQRGIVTLITATATYDITINAVTLARAFIVLGGQKGSGSTYGADDYARAELTSTTNLQITFSQVGGGGPTVAWQVIEDTDGDISAQRGLVTITENNLSVTDTITAIDTAKSFLVFTFRSPDQSDGNMARRLVRGRITSTTQLTFDRDASGNSINVDISWEVVEFTDASIVRSGTVNFGTSVTQVNETISGVVLSRSLVISGGYYHRGGKTNYTADDNPGVACVTLDLTSTTNLRLTRALHASATADVGYFVVELAAAVAANIEGGEHDSILLDSFQRRVQMIAT